MAVCDVYARKSTAQCVKQKVSLLCFFMNMCVEVHGSRYCNSVVNILRGWQCFCGLCCFSAYNAQEEVAAGGGGYRHVGTKKVCIDTNVPTRWVLGRYIWMLNVGYRILFLCYFIFSFFFCAFYFGGLIARLMRMQVLVIV